jgi:hypothetical protein
MLPCGTRRGEVDLSEPATWHVGGTHMSGQYSGGTHLAEVDQWGADTWHWSGPMRCWHVSYSLSSLILCVYVWDPQFAPRWVSVPKLHPDEPLIESEPLIFLFNLFYLPWIYFNSSTYPKIMKFLSKIPKFMMIIPVIFNSIFYPYLLELKILLSRKPCFFFWINPRFLL